MTYEIPDEFWQAVEQFNAQEFYDCHDTLEVLWMDAEEIDKPFYQGLLQIAVSLYHLKNLNWRGAAILLGEGISRLAEYMPDYHNLDLEKLVTESQAILKALHESGPENVAELAEQLFASPPVAGKRKRARLQLPKLVTVF